MGVKIRTTYFCAKILNKLTSATHCTIIFINLFFPQCNFQSGSLIIGTSY